MEEGPIHLLTPHKFLFQQKSAQMVIYFLVIMTLIIHLVLQAEFEMAFYKL